ncbi:MAG: ligase-associated DNA damage response endonuclease PdeM [Pseudotabrizicola sp.]|uniref:ligase-associated DNA damage response endonuclease PdeM n=1 Tax=Pseudotabrizicola sp. TaxID=2939647 RepID=UPI00272560E5|nr:ligase-associated DNA damage response endonuclease PdeM [Pseudotabrizicola sp.]MDO9637532.1 ligase-associated DNA damage response endonuclease PdeM [Pseudotabrizicola sp.]
MSLSLTLAGEPLIARPSGALFWPDRQLLCVSDLHLGKSGRMARRAGTLLPPYETRETLLRLEAEIEATGASTVICLGDSFDDSAALDGLDEADRLWLTRLIAGRDWIWIAGNHDAGPLEIAGSHRAEVHLGGLVFRHIAEPGAVGEVSGHYHPKARLAGKVWRCYLADRTRLILPAFGTYTGGLWTHDVALTRLMQPGALAILCGGTVARAMPMPRRA